MREIQASEAKTHLAQLLDEVERGETILISRHGKPIARIIPETQGRATEKRAVIERIREFRNRRPSVSLDEILSWRHEGHKY
jgi:prevent-host-death family protein